jgi:hypothetical protein
MSASAIVAPDRIDQLAQEYVELRDAVDKATQIVLERQEPANKMREILIMLVSEHGSLHAAKSKLLRGMKYELMATYGSTTSLDAAAIETFRAACLKNGQKSIVDRIFDTSVRYTISPEGRALAQMLPLKLLGMFAKCEVSKPKTPVLVVREK